MDSIQEQIIKKVADALNGITIANGYQNTINSVQRYRASGVDLANMPTILVKEGDCAPELAKSAYPHIQRRMELFVVVCVSHDEAADSRSGGEILNSLVADIETALSANQTWDGLAILTMPPEYLTIEIEAVTPHLARGLRFEILYEHVRSNPWTQ